MGTGLKGKVVVITGGASGIGAAMAIEYAKQGSKVYVCGRNKDKLASFIRLAKEQNIEMDGKVCDVSDEKALQTFAEYIAQQNGGIDIWVNNAGIVIKGYLMDIDIQDWNTVIYTNLTSVLIGSRIAAEYMMKRGDGCIPQHFIFHCADTDSK